MNRRTIDAEDAPEPIAITRKRSKAAERAGGSISAGRSRSPKAVLCRKVSSHADLAWANVIAGIFDEAWLLEIEAIAEA